MQNEKSLDAALAQDFLKLYESGATRSQLAEAAQWLGYDDPDQLAEAARAALKQ